MVEGFEDIEVGEAGAVPSGGGSTGLATVPKGIAEIQTGIFVFGRL